MLRILLLSLCIAAPLAGCRSTDGFFGIDSNSRTPWFGLNVPLSRPANRKPTLETISESGEHKAQAVPAKQVKAEPATGGNLLSRLLGTESSIPLPADAPTDAKRDVVQLEGPREEFP